MEDVCITDEYCSNNYCDTLYPKLIHESSYEYISHGHFYSAQFMVQPNLSAVMTLSYQAFIMIILVLGGFCQCAVHTNLSEVPLMCSITAWSIQLLY